MGNGLILGRSPNLVIGTFTALLNVAVLVLAANGTTVTPELVAALNIAAGAIVALIANTSSIQVAAGDAAKARAK